MVKKLLHFLARTYRNYTEPPPPNLKGDRDIEYSWVFANMPEGPGNALDFGSGPGYTAFVASRKGFQTIALDLTENTFLYEYPQFRFIRGDIFKENFPKEHFNLIINCSSIEHVGVAGRYGIEEQQEEGDIKAMEIMRSLTKKGGVMLLTLPVGVDSLFAPFHRVYGKERLPRLLKNWQVVKKEFWMKGGKDNLWRQVDENTALGRQPVVHCYSLGLFVLRKT